MTQTPARLDALIEQVREAHPQGDPLDLVAEAVTVADSLTETADHLVGHFVDHARNRGLSWTQIGTRIGISKQAARVRFATQDVPHWDPEKQKAFARYTPAARHAVVIAHDTARRRRHGSISPLHLLLGVCREPQGLGALVLEELGHDPEEVGRSVAGLLPEAADAREPIPFTADAKKTLELTLRAALRIGHEHVGTEHLLLGLRAQEDGPAVAVLAHLAPDPDALEREVLRAVAENPKA